MIKKFSKLTLICIASLALAQEGDNPTKDKEDDTKEKVVEKVLTNEAGKKIDKLIETAKNSEDKEENLEEISNRNGFLLGTGLALKELSFSQVISGFEALITRDPSLDVGLSLGYQHYFNTYVGLRVSGMINTGGKAQIKYTKVIPATKIQPAPSKPSLPKLPQPSTMTTKTPSKIPATEIQAIHNIAQTYYPIRGNIDFKVLIDFYTKEKHSVGLNLGMGYEIEWLVVGDASADVETGTSGSLTKLIQKPHSLTDSAIYPTVGLHYYFGKHQFELNYKFAEYAFIRKSSRWDFNTGNKELLTKTRFSTKNSLSLSYMYRF